MYRLTRKEAAKIARRHGHELMNLVLRSCGGTGELLLLHSGAKLAMMPAGKKHSYWIKHYAADGSDLQAVLKLLA